MSGSRSSSKLASSSIFDDLSLKRQDVKKDKIKIPYLESVIKLNKNKVLRNEQYHEDDKR